MAMQDWMLREGAEKLAGLGASLIQTAVSFESTVSGTRTGVVKLFGVSPSTLYVAERPGHQVGYVATEDVVDSWLKGEHSYAKEPPNAVISFVATEDISPEHAVVVLHHPVLDHETLTYEVEVLEGHLPAASGECVLFIEP